jgi:hypothetical protein
VRPEGRTSKAENPPLSAISDPFSTFSEGDLNL